MRVHKNNLPFYKIIHKHAFKKILFHKENLKYFLIWPISVSLAIFFKLYGFLKPESLLINNFLVLLLVFGPALVVTIILVFNKILKFDRN